MYSLKDLSTMTMLSDRTLRNYLDAGILQGKKENGAWVFTSEQIELFLQNDMGSAGCRPLKSRTLYLRCRGKERQHSHVL